VHIHSGETYGFEALLRGWETAGFSSIQEVFDRAENDGVLLWLSRRLREIAEGRFREARLPRRVKLFFNIDNRVFSLLPERTEEDLFPATDESGERSHWFCVELSERHELRTHDRIFRELRRFQDRNISVAIDDFGTGFAGLQLLYEANPDIIKIDRFFVADVHDDQTKKLFVTNLVHMAHTMGILVIAEGVESPQEFYTCREVGCDFVQGYLVQKPQLELTLLQENYERVRGLVREDRRRYTNTRERLLRWMNYTEPIEAGAPVLSVLNRFRNAVSAHFFPVVNELGEPIGILRERDMKNWVYSPFGISLLMNSSYRHEIISVVSRVPVASIETSLDAIVELHALDPDADAVLLTENGKYRGYLDSRTMVQLIHEREVERARDENPLTRLPGNTVIREYVGERLAYDAGPYLLAYLDFDNFKPFNDLYGFRHGDRVIQLFGDMLKEFGQRTGAFVGHIGGDDFFVAMELRSRSLEKASEAIRLLQRSFRDNVLAFYNVDARQRGCIEAEDRDGNKRCFSILTVSAGGVVIPAGRERRGGEETVLRTLSELKSRAKGREDGLAFRELSVTMV
jgi:diguanylate cyclase (GGDEF)-like protein